jgi:hypothetical protein
MLLLPPFSYFLSVVQLVNEVRQQLQEGAGQAAAVEHVAKNRLARLVGGNVVLDIMHAQAGLSNNF